MGTELKRRDRGARNLGRRRDCKERTIVMDYCGETSERNVVGKFLRMSKIPFGSCRRQSDPSDQSLHPSPDQITSPKSRIVRVPISSL
jgi:hypothetical protein